MKTRDEALKTGFPFRTHIRMMIAESYDLVSDSPSKRIYEAVLS